MKQHSKAFVAFLLFVSLLVIVHAAEPDGSWLDISLIQTRPYKNCALLVINQSYDASRVKRVELPFDFAKGSAVANLLQNECVEYKIGGRYSHSLVIYTIDLLGVDSVELLPRYFKNLPNNYSLRAHLIAHRAIK